MVFREVTLNEDVDNVGLDLTNILDYEQLNSTDTLDQQKVRYVQFKTYTA